MIDKSNRFKSTGDKNFGLTLLKSFYLSQSDQEENLRELIEKMEDEMWINPGNLVKNKSNNVSLSSLSEVSSKNSSKFKVN